MKKIFSDLSLFLLIVILFFTNPCYSQKKLSGYSLNIEIGVPVAQSGTTFNTFWFSAINVSLSGLKQVYTNFFAGPELDYSCFNPGEWLRLDSRLHVINPNIAASYNIHLFKKIILIPEFSLGYSWMIFTNSVTPAQYLKPYNEAGLSIKPGLTMGYLFNKGICIGLSSSYKDIFKRFGVRNSDLYENRKEADHTSYLNMDLHLGFTF